MTKPRRPWGASCSGTMSARAAAKLIRIMIDGMEKDLGDKIVVVSMSLQEKRRKPPKGGSPTK